MSTGLKVKIKSWNGVGFWKWMTNDTDCGICRLPFDGCCPDCRIPGDDCPIGNTVYRTRRRIVEELILAISGSMQKLPI